MQVTTLADSLPSIRRDTQNCTQACKHEVFPALREKLENLRNKIQNLNDIKEKSSVLLECSTIIEWMTNQCMKEPEPCISPRPRVEAIPVIPSRITSNIGHGRVYPKRLNKNRNSFAMLSREEREGAIITVRKEISKTHLFETRLPLTKDSSPSNNSLEEGAESEASNNAAESRSNNSDLSTSQSSGHLSMPSFSISSEEIQKFSPAYMKARALINDMKTLNKIGVIVEIFINRVIFKSVRLFPHHTQNDFIELAHNAFNKKDEVSSYTISLWINDRKHMETNGKSPFELWKKIILPESNGDGDITKFHLHRKVVQRPTPETFVLGPDMEEWKPPTKNTKKTYTIKRPIDHFHKPPPKITPKKNY